MRGEDYFRTSLAFWINLGNMVGSQRRSQRGQRPSVRAQVVRG